MSKYDEEVLEHLGDTAKLLFEPFLLKYFLLLALPTLVFYKIGSGVLFVLFLLGICLWARSGKLGGLLGWFVVSLTIFSFYCQPEMNHFIEYLLRAPARVSSNDISSLQVHNAIPESLSSKLFWSLVFGLRGGFIIGVGIGLLGRKIWGYHPRIAP
ncbi:hypothetical protein [Shewanella sp. YIC-542]|uniref:hypothetical protein n=1 Tax=Shewanella mytili TaxID=3377111 RepID=UPI00398ED5F4